MPTAAYQRTPDTDPNLPATFDLFEDAAIGMAFVSLDGHFLRVNEALCDLLGRNRDGLLSATWSELTHPDDLATTREQEEALLSGERHRIDFQKRYLRPDGELTTARVTISLTTTDGQRVFFTQMYDVSDEVASLAGVCAAERRFQALTSASNDAVYWVQLQPEVRFRYVNDAASAMTGYGADEIYANPDLPRQIVHPDDWHLLEEMRTGSFSSGAARLRWLQRDGTVVWVEQQVSVLAEADGAVTDVLCIARDVTHRVEAQQSSARHAAQRAAASDLARTCAATHDPAIVLREATAALSRHVEADAIAVWWEVEQDGAFRLAAVTGFTELQVGATVDAVSSHAARVRANQCFTTVARAPAGYEPTVGVELWQEGIDSGVGVEIRSNGRVVGVVAAYSRTARTVQPEDVLFLQSIASTLGACADKVQFDDHLRRAATLDALTGLLNRSALLDQLAHTLELTVENPVTVAICDIDDFRLLNDAYGPIAGDDALRTVAACLRALLGTNAVIGRTGGDEFTIVMSSDRDGSGAVLAHQITAALEEGASRAGSSFAPTVSIGLASGTSADSASDLVTAALAALADAQARGRSQWSHASLDAHDNARRRLELTNSLREAVTRGEIRAHFQPIVCLRQGSIIGFEALARWERPDGLTVSPGEFIPIAEDTGYIHGIGLSILDQACAFLQAARVEHPGRELMVTVNVSPRQLDDPELPARIEEVLSRYTIPRLAICLELTESLLVPGDRPMLAHLHNLKRIGISLAVDDFGTGYSSFAYLTKLPIDLLKLDRAFVTDVHDDPRRIAVVRSVISLARELGIAVLAEGIETEEERDVLATLDCELGQGFLWNRPVPVVEAHALLAREEMLTPTPAAHTS